MVRVTTLHTTHLFITAALALAIGLVLFTSSLHFGTFE